MTSDVGTQADLPKDITEEEIETCTACGGVRSKTMRVPDGCLGWISGVMFACCGHGDMDRRYVTINNGLCYRGEEANKVLGLPVWLKESS